MHLEQAAQTVLVLDFGSQYTQLIARRVREQRVYSVVHPFDYPVEKIRELAPIAIILSGGPQSVYGESAPICSREVFELGIPILGVDSWNGFAGYANWNMTPHFTLSGRSETFKDNQGARTGISQTWNEGTITLQFSPQWSNAKLRAEFRNDSSNQSVFARYTTPFGTASKNNSSFGLEAIYTWP